MNGWIFGILAVVLGGGFILVKIKDHEISKFREQNEELKKESAVAEAERRKAIQKAEISEAAKNAQERIYKAVADRKEPGSYSDTPLNDKEIKDAKDIMANHSS